MRLYLNMDLRNVTVTRSVLGADVYAFSNCLDYTSVIAHDLFAMLDRKIKTVMFTGFKCLFDTTAKLSTVSQKRLLINIEKSVNRT